MVVGFWRVMGSWSREQVWASLVDVRLWTVWRSEVSGVEVSGSLRQGVEGVVRLQEGGSRQFSVPVLLPLEVLVVSEVFKKGVELRVKWACVVEGGGVVVSQEVVLLGSKWDEFWLRSQREVLAELHLGHLQQLLGLLDR